MDIETLYRDLILQHARGPKNIGSIDDPDLSGSASNRLCGDELELTLTLDGDQISLAKARVRGCAVLQASTSMMTEFLVGKNYHQAAKLGEAFRALLSGEGEAPESLKDLAPLLQMRKQRARHTCVLLPWDALDDCEEEEKS